MSSNFLESTTYRINISKINNIFEPMTLGSEAPPSYHRLPQDCHCWIPIEVYGLKELVAQAVVV